MSDHDLARLVSLACHDLRSPLATINGFAKTLTRSGDLGERDARYAGIIGEAAEQLADLLDLLGLAARIAGDRYEPQLRDADTLELASSPDERIAADGAGELITTDAEAVGGSLDALAIAAVRHGSLPAVTWTVAGRTLTLAPVTEEAAPIVAGESARDLGALVARMVIEQLGGSLAIEGGTLRVTF